LIKKNLGKKSMESVKTKIADESTCRSGKDGRQAGEKIKPESHAK